MEEELEEERNLLAGIAREADRKAAEIEEEAASYARTRAEAARTQAGEILRKAEETAAAQCESVRRNAESRAAVEARKTSLRIRDRLIQDTLDAARRVVAEAEERPGYAEVLRLWIVEAAVGLSAPEARVNASREELPRITDALLREAEREVQEFTGKPVRLSRVEGDPLPAQGVVLTAPDGRLAYNNQVPTRFLRAQSEIRKRMHAVLFGEGAPR